MSNNRYTLLGNDGNPVHGTRHRDFWSALQGALQQLVAIQDVLVYALPGGGYDAFVLGEPIPAGSLLALNGALVGEGVMQMPTEPPTLNKELLIAVRDRILADPAGYDQSNFCGTTCCIAGHVAKLHDETHGTQWFSELNTSFISNAFDALGRFELALERIRLVMGLTEIQWRNLCESTLLWPSPFDMRFSLAEAALGSRSRRIRARAKIAAERIDYLIETGV